MKKTDDKSIKLKFLRISRIMLVLFSTFFFVFIVGCHSDYLINQYIKWISFELAFISFLICLICLIKYFIIKEKRKLSKKRWILNILVILYFGCMLLGINLLYGKNKSFRDWFVTTSMQTMTHQYYARIFYSTNEIIQVMNSNYIIEPEGETNLFDFVLNNEFNYDKSNIYEADIYKNHTSNELYRMKRFTVNGQQAYLAIIYDPSMVHVAYTKNLNVVGEYVVDMAKRTNALVAVNGGRFKDINFKGTGGIPQGVTISNGKIITDYKYESKFGLIGINKDNQLVLYKNKTAGEMINLGIRECVTSTPFLIVNGKSAFSKGNGGWGYAARTAIGQRQDGVILLLVVDSNETRTNGASMKDLTEIMEKYGAINAAALDGGTSTVMVEKGVLISDPINSSFKHQTRPIATSLVVTTN